MVVLYGCVELSGFVVCFCCEWCYVVVLHGNAPCEVSCGSFALLRCVVVLSGSVGCLW